MKACEDWTKGETEKLSGKWSKNTRQLMEYAVLCSNSIYKVEEDGKKKFEGEPIENAILEAAIKKGISPEELSEKFPRVDELPFDSERKLMTTIHSVEDKYFAVVKGAPEILVTRCADVDKRNVLLYSNRMAKNAMRVIAVAVREGGPDPSSNSKLKDVIAKAKSNNVPNDNIERIIKKAAGETGGANYEEIIYEGYGPSGIAVIVEALTDNRNRTAGDVRHYFDKFGGNMGQSGCVSFLFSRQGVILIDPEDVDEEKLMDAALEAGAVDFISDDGIFDIRTEPNDIGAVRDALEAQGYSFVSAEVEYVPSTYTRLESEDDIKGMSKMLEMFEDNDDIQAVWHNWENADDAE